ncbi:DNA internalization-related competence protein ComEC/Rec2 [uncultured Haemophilus sp.]|uniref:DNA internalization-related competence protein ComEC/Rec2 n=1 Tax=uncultured Haemophilus sp. TaxID=237779 RepID=UPI0025E19330|nr:DNA internalization-related competence protein ComEC/Rec2 [uncultured Haemophilus sp.]
MKITLFQLCMMLIVSALSLLVVPDFLLFSWQQAWLSILMLVMTALCFHWFNYFKARNFCMSVILFLITLAYAHSPALSLLGQAERISSLPNKLTLDLHISEILHQQDYQTLVATTSLFDGKTQQIFLNWKAQEKPQVGEIWRADVKLRPISARLNHRGFDRQQWDFSKRIIAVGNVKSAVKIGDDFSYRTHFLQNSLKQTEGFSLQGLLIALAFGERAWLDDKTWLIYQQTNTAHLIAISGLHIGLAMGIGFFFARLLQLALPTRFISPWFPLCFGVLIALGYAYLAGFSLPTFRAMMALLFIAILQFSRRYYTPSQMLCLVVAFLLFCDPLMPLSVSFWLSVGAVTCLIVWYRYVPLSIIEWRHQKLSRKVRWILGLFHLQIGLLILFTPIQLFFFNGLALNGFLANLIAVPLYSFLLVPLILFAVLTHDAFSSWYFANEIAQGITQSLRVFQGAYVPISINLSLILTALLNLVFGGVLYRLYFASQEKTKNTPLKSSRFFTLNSTKILSAKEYKQALLGIILIFSICMSTLGYRYLTKPKWQLDTLDVGQGLATLIVKEGKGVLYDTGPAWQNGIGASSMAELEILPYLQREGIELETLILSHDDNDHSGGAKAILAAYPDIELITPSRKNYGETHRTFCLQGKQWLWRGLDFKVLSPTQITDRAENPQSCVILLTDGQYKILLTGDADVATERAFAENIGKINVLQVGHHGSKTSTGEFLLALTKPDLALISSGRWNAWNFPHPTVIERLNRYQSAVENTAISGHIRLNFTEKGIEIEKARGDFSPWFARVIGLSPK